MQNKSSIAQLRCKEVINLCDGARLGYVYDVEMDLCTGQVLALVVQGRPRLGGLLGYGPDTIIFWGNIQKIGEDIIFVDQPLQAAAARIL